MKRKPIVENVPTNSMGMSSATPGTGPIDTYNPILNRNKIVHRLMTIWKRTKANSHDRTQSK